MNALLDYGSDDSHDDNKLEDIEEEKCFLHDKVDFFNLASSNHEESSDDQQKLLKRELRTPSGLSIEVPAEEFWEPVSAEDIKFVIETKEPKNAIQTFGITPFKTSRTKNRSNDTQTGIKRQYGQSHYRHSQLAEAATVSKNNEQSKILKDHSFDSKQIYSKHQVEDKSAETKTDSQINNRKLFYLHSIIKPHLKRKPFFKIPKDRGHNIIGHSGPVTRVKWNNTQYSHLLLSAAMDGMVKLWNFWSSLDPCVQTMGVHTKAVKDACWSHSGKEIISCGYDKRAIISDVEGGKPLVTFQHENYVNCVKCHPNNTNVIVSGSYNILQAWDKRAPDQPVQEFIYKDNTGQVQDVIFSSDGRILFSCCDVLSRDSADRNIMAWDVSSGVVLSNQIYQERYSCTRLKLHPTEGHFLAQTNGDYIAIFSTHKPYKLNKVKRFQGHKGLGYAVGFDVSLEGSVIASGSADGNIYFYNYHTGRPIRTLNTGLPVCTDVALHPVLPSTVACCGWNGHIQVWR